jgi:hypothetical protein
MSFTHRLSAIAMALALSALAAAAPLAASALAVPDAALRSGSSSLGDSATQAATGSAGERLAVASPPAWPTHPQVLTAPATSAPAADDGPSWTAAILVGGLLLFAAAGLGALAGRASAGARRAGA